MRGKRTRPSDDVWNGHGGYMGLKKQKLVQQFQEQAQNEHKEKGIFSGVSIFVNGWTNPSADELKRIMMTHDGVYHHYYNSHKTTHIIASNLPDVKMRQMKGNELIVKPEWISSCLEADRLVDYKPFLLFSDKSNANKITNFTTKSAINQIPDKHLEESSFKVDNDQTLSSANASTISTSPFKAKDAKDPKFLGEFFQNSRLHHISTMGANAKEYVNTLRDNHTGEFPAKTKLLELQNTRIPSTTSSSLKRQSSGSTKTRTIMHIDMDCFFVSVGLRSRPELVGQPVAVCHAKGNKPSRGAEEDRISTENRRLELEKYKERLGGGNKEEGEAKVSWKLGGDVDGLSSFSEIASCSYEARAKGVRNGMFLGPALKLCPDLKTIPYDFVGYEQVSKILYDTVASYTLDIQAVSCDEMFVDLTSLLNEFNLDPLQFVSLLRKEIKDKTNCACSVGLGSSILLARMATKQAKPDGQFLLQENQVLEHMSGLGVKELPGVGRSLERRLATLGVLTCGDMQAFSLATLQKELGKKTGTQLHNFARGIDDRKLEIQQIRKTVSAEVNYGIRFSDYSDAERFLDQLAGEVSARLSKIHAKGKSITLKLMLRAKDAPEETAKFLGHGVCDNMSRSTQLSSYTCDKQKIFVESMSMLNQVGCIPADIRGIGITVSKLDLEEKHNVSSGGGSILKFMKPSNTSISAIKDTNKNNDAINEDDIFQPDTSKSDNKEEESEKTIDSEAGFSIETNRIDDGRISGYGLDPEVLASLPEEIRLEVIRDYKQHISASDKSSATRPITRGAAAASSASRAASSSSGAASSSAGAASSSAGAASSSAGAAYPSVSGIVSSTVEAASFSAGIAYPSVSGIVSSTVGAASSSVSGMAPSSVSGMAPSSINAASFSPMVSAVRGNPPIFTNSTLQVDEDSLVMSKEVTIPSTITSTTTSVEERESLEMLTAVASTPTTSRSSTKSKNNSQAEPDFGDIDQSVLDQLPPELRQEILQHYKNSKEDVVASNTRTATALANNETAVISKNPGKCSDNTGSGNALSKLIRISPTKKISPVKRKRGRPPKHSVDKSKTTSKLNKLSKVKLNKNRMKVNHEAQRDYVEDNKNFIDEPIEEAIIAEVKTESADVNVDKGKFVPTFCGKSELEDIRPLIKGWLTSTPEPMKDDVQMMVNFLQGLVLTRKIHIVAIILKCIFRNITKLKSGNPPSTWTAMYGSLVNKVQLTMNNCYGHQLFVDHNF